MSSDHKGWVEARRAALLDYYDLPPAEAAEAEEVFSKMEALAEASPDQAAFEQALGASPLAAEYGNLFAKNSHYVKGAIDPEGAVEDVKKKVAGNIAYGAAVGALSGILPGWAGAALRRAPALGRLFGGLSGRKSKGGGGGSRSEDE